MELNLRNFRCWEEKTLYFNEGAVVLLTGPSGAGKSTILEAISWVLYGSMKNLAPFYDPKATTSVTLTLRKTFCIMRQRNPKLLRLEDDGLVLLNLDAQAVIVEQFGSYQVWAASSYIVQKERNNFISASNTEKINILNTLAFPDNDIEKYLTILDNKLIEINAHLDLLIGQYEDKLQAYKEEYGTVVFSRQKAPHSLPILRGRIPMLEEQLDKARALQQKHHTDIALIRDGEKEIRSLEEEIARITIPIHPYPEHALSPDMIEAWCKEATYHIPQLEERERQKQLRTELETKLTTFEYVTGSYTNEDLEKAVVMEREYACNFSKAQSLNIAYTQEALEEEIGFLKSGLEVQSWIPIYEQWQRVKRKMATMIIITPTPPKPLLLPEAPKIGEVVKPKQEILSSEAILGACGTYPKEPNFIPDTYMDLPLPDSSQIDKALVHFLALKQGLNTLVCPHCDGLVSLQEGKLYPSDLHPVALPEVEAAEKQLQTLQEEHRRAIDDRELLIQKHRQEEHKRRQALMGAYHAQVRDMDRRVDEFKRQHDAQYNLAMQEYRKTLFQQEQRVARYQETLAQIQAREHMQQEEYRRARNKMEEQIIEKEQLQQEEKILAAALPSDFSYSPHFRTQKELHAAQERLKNLQRIIWLPPPAPTSEDIRKVLEKQRLQKILEALPLITPSSVYASFSARELEERIQNYSRYIRAYNTAQERKEILTSKLYKQEEELERKRSTLTSNQEATIIALRNEQKELKALILEAEFINKAAIAHDKITTQYNKIVEEQAYYAHVLALRDEAIHTECAKLQDLADNINTYLSDMLNIVFDKPICVTLQLYKTLKTKKRIKPNVNFNVQYKGGEALSLKQVSCGECDRIGIALTLAFNKLMDGPFIMMDEILSTSDEGILDNIVTQIKDYCQEMGKICLITQPTGCVGIFNDVIVV